LTGIYSTQPAKNHRFGECAEYEVMCGVMVTEVAGMTNYK